jgi:hypothetical protein
MWLSPHFLRSCFHCHFHFERLGTNLLFFPVIPTVTSRRKFRQLIGEQVRNFLFSERSLCLATHSWTIHCERLKYCILDFHDDKREAFPLELDKKIARSCYSLSDETFGRSTTQLPCSCVAPEQGIVCFKCNAS